MDKFKCRLKVILAELEIRHGDFAKRVGIDPSTLSALANSKSLPQFETLYSIVEELRKVKPEITLEEIWERIHK